MGVSQKLTLPAPVSDVVANSSLSQISGAQARAQAQGSVLADPLCGAAPSVSTVGLVGQMGTWAVSMANRRGGHLRKRCRQGRPHMDLLQKMTGLGRV